MSRPVSFEIVGICEDGEVLVVDHWPNMKCAPMPEPKVIHNHKTVVIREFVEKDMPVPKPGNEFMWWLTLPVISVGLLYWMIKRRRNRRRTDVFHHKG